ncbi:MAG: T9SS type A sorting domain-containing protein [Crocinitomicaceae bacterium]
MKSLALLTVSFIYLSATAQISVNSSDFISGPDTVLVSVVTDYQNINYQNTGANQTWDFSWVEIDSQRIDTFSSVSSAGFIYQLVFNNFLSPSYQASYFQKADLGVLPTGGLPIAFDNPISFDKISSSSYEKVGFGADLNGIALPIQADTIDVVYEFPMTYQDNWTSNSFLFLDLNPGFNAMFKRHQNRSSIVDGYGAITTTFGTFDCIRVKSSLNFTDSLFFDLTGTGGAWIPLPSQPEIQYRWIAKNNKIPLLTINVSNSILGPEITKVEMRDKKGVANLTNSNSFKLKVYPNPASEVINIIGIENIDELTITDLEGKLIYTNQNINANKISINCDNWSKGLYILSAISDQKTVINKLVLQ